MTIQRLGALCALTSLYLFTATAPAGAADALPQHEQQPLTGPGELPAIINDDSTIGDGGDGQAAKIILYPGSRTYPDDLRDMGKKMPDACSDEERAEVVELATDVCLSGEYYLRDNFKIVELPRCKDGSTPTAMFYQHRHCSGSPRAVAPSLEQSKNACLWPERLIPASSYYWSFIFRCESDTKGALEHQTAIPTLLHQNVGGARGSIRHHGGDPFSCHTEHGNRTHASETEAGNCWWPLSHWPIESLEILAPAVCNNGTRAQLALYEDVGNTGLSYMCMNGEMTLENSLMDVDDWMLNNCIPKKNLKLKRGGLAGAQGVMFYCDGMRVKDQEPLIEDEFEVSELQGARTSHSECGIYTGRYSQDEPSRPKTFMYPDIGSCVTLPKDHQVRFHEKPTCPDGSVGKVAQWREPGCQGWPKKITGVDYLNCQNWNRAGASSYMFWCDHEAGLKASERNDRGQADPRAVVTTDECPRLNMEPGWTVVGRDDGPTIKRIEVDECFDVYKDDQLKVYVNAQCPNGNPPKLAVHNENRQCEKKPDKRLDVMKLMDTCTQICDKSARSSCYAKFVC